MLLALKLPNGDFPPGGFPFVDPRTQRVWNGYEGTADMHAASIIIHRRANPNIYPPSEGHWFDKQSVIQEIFQQKFKTHPYIFRGQPEPNQAVKLIQPKGVMGVCPQCQGTRFETQYCPTCSGKRITGYKCLDCGATRT